jgi:hypothetical protein
MADDPQGAMNTGGTDILFECPHCEKSLAIDARGSGLSIRCPQCGRTIQVPGLPGEDRGGRPGVGEVGNDPQERFRILSEELALSQTKVERLVASLEEVRERRHYLEKLRADNMARLEVIAKEMSLVQNAVDRVLSLLHDAKAEGLEPGRSAGAVHEDSPKPSDS